MNAHPDIPQPLHAALDLELARCGWTDAEAAWDRARQAALDNDGEAFARHMAEFRRFRDNWTPREAAQPNKRAVSNR